MSTPNGTASTSFTPMLMPASIARNCSSRSRFSSGLGGRVQKRSSVCKFAGKAYVGDKLAAEANFTAMIADPPAA